MNAPVKRTKKATRGLTDEQLDNELLWRSWFPSSVRFDARDVIPDDEVDVLVEGFRKFCAEAIRIKVPGDRVPLILRDAQLDTIRSWITNRYTITLKARQIGFSTLAAAFSLWVAMGGADRQIYMLSKKEKDSVSLLNKAKFAFKSMPLWVRERAPQVLDRTTLRMSFDNDSFIESSPTASDPIRGETAFLVIVDEWASFPNEEEAWAAIEPVTDIGGRVVGLSTAKGEGSFFHRLWVGATTGSNSFVPVFHPWWAVPSRDAAWYENKKSNMEPWQLYQEYPSNPEEAFIGSGNPFFDLELLRRMTPRVPVARLSVEAADTGSRFITEDGGDLVVFTMPEHGESYAVGADVALGLEHGDWSTAFVLNAKSGEIVAVYRGKVEPDYFAKILSGIGFMYNLALLTVEANNMGHTTIKELSRRRYPFLYRRHSQLKRRESMTDTLGWYTSHGNKADLLNQLSAWLRDHNVPHEPTIAELKTFTREQKGERVKLSGSPHDDLVMGLAIAVESRNYAVVNKVGRVRERDVPNSIEWWAKRLEKQKSRSKRRIQPVF